MKKGRPRGDIHKTGHVDERDPMMLRRVVMAAILTGLFAAGGTSGARAQQPISSGSQAPTASGWTFNLTAYLWMPSINANVNYSLPPALGGTVSASPSLGFGDLVSHLNLAFMGAADARYDRFSVLTDIMYMNVGGVAGQLRSVNFPGHPSIPITTSVSTNESMKMNAVIWTLAGGYTVVEGPWGNFDAIAGFRYFGVNTRVNYSLAVSIAGPRGNGATFGGVGGVSATGDIWNGIAGFRGRVRIGDTPFFIPYYFDIGTGSSNLTWQIASGVGYKIGWADISLTYRYLSFEQNSTAAEAHLWFQGPMLAVNLRF
jgi:hypothetical protein